MSLTPQFPLFIVFNAASGHEDACEHSVRIVQRLKQAGREHQLTLVERPSDLNAVTVRAVHAARESGGVVVAAGGDGTLSAIAQLVWNAGLPLGVLPQGTFNYFGRTHGIPADIDQAIDLLLSAEPTPVTVGLLGERLFLINASVGLYPQLLEDREHAKRRFGRHRIVALWSGLGSLLRGGSVFTLELQAHGQTRVARTRTLFVGNNELQMREIGLREAPDVEQGHLAAILLQPLPLWRTLWLVLRGAVGRLDGAEGVESFVFDRLVVRPRRQGRLMKVAMDGEITRMQPPLEFQVAPRPLMVMLPPRRAGEPGA